MILIVADDQGFGDMWCHCNPVIKTPKMDQLYAESVRLTSFHVAPLLHQNRVTGYLLKGFINTYLGGDRNNGELISLPFRIE